MSEDEKDFVQGQSLRTKGRTNEDPYNESAFDAYVNPFNFLGNLYFLFSSFPCIK